MIICIAAINDLGDARSKAHLICGDAADGIFPGAVDIDGAYMILPKAFQ